MICKWRCYSERHAVRIYIELYSSLLIHKIVKPVTKAGSAACRAQWSWKRKFLSLSILFSDKDGHERDTNEIDDSSLTILRSGESQK